MSEEIRTFTVNATDRLDRFLVGVMPDFSRSRLQILIGDGYVTVKGAVVTKTGFKVESGFTVEIHLPETQPSKLVGEDIKLDIIFENDNLMVVNKPAGMVVHPAIGHSHGTLVQAALGHAPEMEGIGGETRPGVVHRLDKDTSGIILLAKNDRSHRWLQDQFRLRKVVKVYYALVDGVPPTPEGKIDAPIGRDPVRRKQMAIVPIAKGREAVTEYHTVERFAKHTLIEAHPLTGRTHQIRLHMTLIKCPIVGDVQYGHKHSSIELNRHFLHAGKLIITLPGETTPRTFEAPLPPELVAVLETLRNAGHNI